MNRPEIDYPCEWEYRIIGSDEENMRRAVVEIIKAKQHTLSFSNISKAGKYISLALETIVVTEEERNGIYVSLRKHRAIKSVI